MTSGGARPPSNDVRRYGNRDHRGALICGVSLCSLCPQRTLNPLTALSVDDINSIHQASLTILRDVGIHVPHLGVLQALAESGAQIDLSQEVARIPERLVSQALQQAGKQYILYGRDRSKYARFGYGDFVLVSTAGQYSWIDEDGKPRRDPTSADLKNGILVGDALEHIDVVGGMAMPLDVPVAVRDVYMAAQLIKGTSKPTYLWVAKRYDPWLHPGDL